MPLAFQELFFATGKTYLNGGGTRGAFVALLDGKVFLMDNVSEVDPLFQFSACVKKGTQVSNLATLQECLELSHGGGVLRRDPLHPSLWFHQLSKAPRYLRMDGDADATLEFRVGEEPSGKKYMDVARAKHITADKGDDTKFFALSVGETLGIPHKFLELNNNLKLIGKLQLEDDDDYEPVISKLPVHPFPVPHFVLDSFVPAPLVIPEWSMSDEELEQPARPKKRRASAWREQRNLADHNKKGKAADK